MLLYSYLMYYVHVTNKLKSMMKVWWYLLNNRIWSWTAKWCMHVCKIGKGERNDLHTHTHAPGCAKYLVSQEISCLTWCLCCACCSCVSGYMGERCQFSDLEWWQLQQAEEEKRRNVVIAACMVLLVSLLSVAACVTYCYGWEWKINGRFKQNWK